jgi:hypothetical protein
MPKGNALLGVAVVLMILFVASVLLPDKQPPPSESIIDVHTTPPSYNGGGGGGGGGPVHQDEPQELITNETTPEINSSNNGSLQVTPTSIAWGTLDRGQSKSIMVEVRNNNNVTAFSLSVIIQGANPENFFNFAYLSENVTGYIINPLGTVTANLTLSIDKVIPLNITEFSFNIRLDGVGD